VLTAAPSEVRPFRIGIPEADLADLRDRVARTRWPDEPEGLGWSRGVPVNYLKALAEYWATSFDWRQAEERLNEHPHVTTVVDGQTVHCMHARSPDPSAFPLALLHGWPGSFAELLPVVRPLRDAFHVVVPSIPGFGFSTPLVGTGWSATRIARVVAELMHRLGYTRYGVHGTDLGAGVAGALSAVDPDGVVGVHVASDPQTAVTFSMFTGDAASAEGLTDAERRRVEAMKQAAVDDQGYLRIQTTRPQTLAYALTDSPVGQLAWIVEKFQAWTAGLPCFPRRRSTRICC
jgi:pimeloyl-ACP methyl ester carboxylesterase